MTALGLPDGGDPKQGRPPVHYQISITGRQAGLFFLLLLAALSLAFFFGMRTGAAARRGPAPAATLVAASDLPVPTLAPSEASRENRKAEASVSKPAEEPLGFPEKRAALKATAAPTPVPPPAPSPTAKPAAPAPPKEAPAAKTAPKGPFFVQILATKKAQAADELMKRLKGEGFAADVTPVPGKEGWFRVRVGPFKERAKAEATAKKIRQTDKQIRKTPLVVS